MRGRERKGLVGREGEGKGEEGSCSRVGEGEGKGEERSCIEGRVRGNEGKGEEGCECREETGE